jgi:hypothetical protein
MSIFEINDLSAVQVEYIDDSPIYIMENFYKNPNSVLSYLHEFTTTKWKYQETPSYNGIHFDDRRQRIEEDQITPVYQKLSELCNKKTKNENYIITNITKFYKTEFNDYENNYWWPHKDSGYNAIVYFNEEENSGTNLYENISDKIVGPEHANPWRPKEKWKLIKSLSSGYNKLVMFDGLKFYHGMNICNETFFLNEYIVNQVLFFK